MHLIPSFTLEGFNIGPIYVYTWGLTAAIGVLTAIFLALRKTNNLQVAVGNSQKKISEEQFWTLSIVLTLSIFIGARILYIFETWNYYAADPVRTIQIWQGGFSLFGGALVGIVAVYYWSRRNKINFWMLGWIFTPAWLFGLFFGRLGCFLIHDHLGKPTSLPWGVWVQGAYRHEPAMYEAIWILLIGTGLYFLDKRYPSALADSGTSPSKGEDKSGEVYLRNILFPLSLMLYSVGRFFIDFFRVGDDHFYNLTLAQWFCVAVVVLVGKYVIRSSFRFRRGWRAFS